jgi:hypothetical protein
MREERRGLQQTLTGLRERERSAGEQCEVKRRLAAEFEAQEQVHLKHHRDADVAAASVDAFIRHFDAYFETKHSEKDAHQKQYQAAEKQLGFIADAKREFDQAEPELERAENEARDAVRDFQRELSMIEYADEADISSNELLASLRERYRGEVLRFEGQFKDTAAQGQLVEKQNYVRRLKQRSSGDGFRGVSTQLAEALIAAGQLHTAQADAQQQHEYAKTARTTAELLLSQARNERGKINTPSKDEKPLQGELIPERSVDLNAKVAELQANSAELDGQFQKVREEKSAAQSALAENTRNADRFAALGRILTNLDVVAAETVDMSLFVGEEESKVDALCIVLRDARQQTDQERNGLTECHGGIQKVVQTEEFSREFLIPARTLFASLSLTELLQGSVAAEREQAVQEQTATLKVELEQMQKHRDLIVRELLTEAEKAIGLLRRAERLSRLPETVGEWSGEPFLRIHLHGPHSEEEKVLRLRGYVEELLSNGTMPDGVRLVFNALVALVTEKGMDATILKPEEQRRRQRYGVREMSGWSEGERTTVAIILYCTLVKLRAQSRGVSDRRAEVSALLLDNPIGKASKPEFLEMHRWIAGALGVQLIYATGVNDPQALSVFPNRIRLAKNRIIPQTHELAVGIIPEDANLVVRDIRIFDAVGERPHVREATES